VEAIIKANEHVANGFSVEDAEKLRPHIHEVVLKKTPVLLDFDGVKFFTTLFFSQALTYLVGEIGADEYDGLIKVKNLSESGEATYEHALTYARDYYSKTEEKRREHDSIVEKVFEEL